MGPLGVQSVSLSPSVTAGGVYDIILFVAPSLLSFHVAKEEDARFHAAHAAPHCAQAHTIFCRFARTRLHTTDGRLPQPRWNERRWRVLIRITLAASAPPGRCAILPRMPRDAMPMGGRQEGPATRADGINNVIPPHDTTAHHRVPPLLPSPFKRPRRAHRCYTAATLCAWRFFCSAVIRVRHLSGYLSLRFSSSCPHAARLYLAPRQLLLRPHLQPAIRARRGLPITSPRRCAYRIAAAAQGVLVHYQFPYARQPPLRTQRRVADAGPGCALPTGPHQRLRHVRFCWHYLRDNTRLHFCAAGCRLRAPYHIPPPP